MGKIIDPTQPTVPELKVWLNAFTCIQECSADAADNSEIRRSVSDNVKMLRARVKENADPQAQKLLDQQELIQRQMFQKRPELHRELMKLWRNTVEDLISYSWNVAEEVHYEEDFKGGPMLFWQGDLNETPRHKKVTVTRPRAVLIIRFLKFVSAHSGDTSPIEYTKQMLLKQGINEENFHLYEDQLVIPNPWTQQ